MHAQTETDNSRFSGVAQSRNHRGSNDLETIKELSQQRFSLVHMTRKIEASDNCRLSAVIEISRAMAALERAADHIIAAR